MPRGDGTGPAGAGRGNRVGRSTAAGPGGYCVCRNCGYREPHAAGSPCNQKMCPKCAVPLTRDDRV